MPYSIGSFANQIDDMGEAEMFSYLDNLEDAFGGDFATIDEDSFKQMGNMIQYMDLEDFEEIPAATVSVQT